jgi:hypothetical protein
VTGKKGPFDKLTALSKVEGQVTSYGGNRGTLLTNWTRFAGIEESQKLGAVDSKNI